MKSTLRQLFICLFFSGVTYAETAITYELNGGRLGNNLASYSAAKWVSYIHKIPLLYVPFPYSDQLKLHYKEKRFLSTYSESQFDTTLYYSPEALAEHGVEKNILYISEWYSKATPNFRDKEFRAVMQELIAPIEPISYIHILKNHRSVALHIRTGGGFKLDDLWRTSYPRRFAPIHYYADQLKRLISLFPDELLYVYIFTDDATPENLVQQLQELAPSIRITYGYREEKNRYNKNVLEDFFCMTKFEILVRPVSDFSKFVEHLGDTTLSIIPLTYHFISENEWVIDTVRVTRIIDDKRISEEVQCDPHT